MSAAPSVTGLLVSDVDSTFITQEVIELVAQHAGTRAQVEEITARAMRGELVFAASLRARVATLAGLPATVLAKVAAAVEPTPGALELVRRAGAAGWRTALVSGGFHEIVDPLAERAGIDHVLANRFEIRDGLLTGGLTGPIIDREAKARELERLAAVYGVPRERTVAVGDGANDIELLRTAGIGIAFRAKPALRQVADVQLDTESLLGVWPLMTAVAER